MQNKKITELFLTLQWDPPSAPVFGQTSGFSFLALYKSTYLDSCGSGAKRIMDACREHDVENPTWR